MFLGAFAKNVKAPIGALQENSTAGVCFFVPENSNELKQALMSLLIKAEAVKGLVQRAHSFPHRANLAGRIN